MTDRLRNVSHRTVVAAVSGVVVLAFAAVALAGSGFKNGGFETGFEGWNVAASEDGWFVRHSAPLPLSGKSWRGPTEHDFALVSDQDDPASGVVYRFIKVGSKNVRLTLTVYYTNYYTGGFCTPSSFDETMVSCNQQFRIDILRAGASPWSLSGGDVIKSVFKTKGGNPDAIDPTTVVKSLTGLGDKVMLRIAFVENRGVLNATVDDIRVDAG